LPSAEISAWASTLESSSGDGAIDGGGTRGSAVILADTDANDVLASPFLSAIKSAREHMPKGTKVVPCTLDVHVALVQSDELLDSTASARQ
jgi:hypothetical protein